MYYNCFFRASVHALQKINLCLWSPAVFFFFGGGGYLCDAVRTSFHTLLSLQISGASKKKYHPFICVTTPWALSGVLSPKGWHLLSATFSKWTRRAEKKLNFMPDFDSPTSGQKWFLFQTKWRRLLANACLVGGKKSQRKSNGKLGHGIRSIPLFKDWYSSHFFWRKGGGQCKFREIE